MLCAGLDLSRQRLDVRILDAAGRTVELTAVRPDADALRSLAERVARYGEPVEAAIESMNGARFVHDTLERLGWDVAIADAVRPKGLAPLVAKTDRIDAWVLAELARRELVPAIAGYLLQCQGHWSRAGQWCTLRHGGGTCSRGCSSPAGRLEPRDGGTRLIERFQVTMAPPTAPSSRTMSVPGFARSMLGFGVFVMVRRQMLGIRDRAEGRPVRAWSVRFPHRRPLHGAGQSA